MQEEWAQIADFPNYSISSFGRVVNESSGRILAVPQNQRGIAIVGLMLNGIQHKRSVAVLVADYFLDPPKYPKFDTPVHLDADRTNCRFDNLVWRPRWFAVKYHVQFENPPRYQVPIVEQKTQEVFPTSMHAAMRFGLLDREIFMAMLNNTYVWPTYQTFKLERPLR